MTTYKDNMKGKILGEGIGRNPCIITIKNVLLVKGIKYNLLSIIQLCDGGYSIVFDTLSFLIGHKASKDLVFKGSRIENVYMLDLDDMSMHENKCSVAKNEDYWLWHRHLSHMHHLDLLNKITSKNLVVGLPKIKLKKQIM